MQTTKEMCTNKRRYTYADAGVDIDRGDKFVESIKRKVESTYNGRVVEGVGGFAALYKAGNGKLLAAGTDGVGTKLKIAQKLGIHNTIGIDLVAMCVNDVLCTGATPLFFLDYLASSKLDLAVSNQIIDGIVKGCQESNMALIGGETAEMPGMYAADEYDLAGFAVGEVEEAQVIDGQKVSAGNAIIGIASSGLHSNGFSLVNKLIQNEEIELLKECLTPTRIYVSLIQSLLSKYPQNILGMAHITGGGISNIQRINERKHFALHSMPSLSLIPSIFQEIKKRANLEDKELYQVFNMGVGFVLVTDTPGPIMSTLSAMNEKAYLIGHVMDIP
ncbi:MAG TPA: phosphoribosylformylglycinamidine cyclo-ligase [Bacteriovoracaceae bacterium]|nr:phosphoribosylformylglycinamidine cyclo-ligase [Bacteriovoracaceae bacterium]